MKIEKLGHRINSESNKKLAKSQAKMQALHDALSKRNLPDDIITLINIEIAEIHAFSGSDKNLIKQLNVSYLKILKIIEKKLKLVPINHYRNFWMVIGMSVFGLPLGVIFSTSTDNYSYIGTGIPIGMALGIVIGINLDKKAKSNGTQLDLYSH